MVSSVSPMTTAYRIFKSKHAAAWSDGEGAFRYGGRWNSPGTRLLYASSSLSLATLEIFVSLNSEQLLSAYSFATLDLSDDLVLAVERFRKLPKNWDVSPPTAGTQTIGDEWAASMASVTLKVPSAVVPGESNYIFNVEHKMFTKVKLGKVHKFTFDRRLI